MFGPWGSKLSTGLMLVCVLSNLELYMTVIHRTAESSPRSVLYAARSIRSPQLSVSRRGDSAFGCEFAPPVANVWLLDAMVMLLGGVNPSGEGLFGEDARGLPTGPTSVRVPGVVAPPTAVGLKGDAGLGLRDARNEGELGTG